MFYDVTEDFIAFECVHSGKIKRDTSYNKLGHYPDKELMYIDAATDKLGQPVSLAVSTYYRVDGKLGLAAGPVSGTLTAMCVGHMKKAAVKNNVLYLNFTFPKTDFSIKRVSLVLRNNLEGKHYDFELTQKNEGRHINVCCRLNLNDVEWEQFYWDVKGVAERDGREFELRIRDFNKAHKLGYLLKNTQNVLPGGEYLVFDYLTKSNDLAFTYRAVSPQDNRKFVRRENLAMFLFYILYPYWKHKNIWLVYEKYSITAQDNSLFFFRYCMTELSEKEKKHIYYVIDKNSPDYARVKEYDDRVIQFLSLKHMIYLKAAALLISSDTKAHAYAWHSPNSVYRFFLKNKHHVFLQHGVIYYKQCHRGLNSKSPNGTNLFIVSSDVEKKIILDYFKYRERNIAVTGLARWDVLESTTKPEDRMILVMPTWREWLDEATTEAFEQSDYYKNYMALLNNPKLHEFLEKNDVEMVFYIHPKFREYMSSFASSSDRIRLIEFGTLPLNELLMKCNMMITDYSSACWDVYYQGKPVLFYIFDLDYYNAKTGSYVDMKTQAFGDATESADELLANMQYYADNGFTEKEKYAKMRDRLLPYRDHKNCERTYNAILRRFY